MYVGFPPRVLWVICGYFAGKRKGMFENNVSDPVITHTEILPGSKLSVLLVRNVIRDAMRSVFCVFPK